MHIELQVYLCVMLQGGMGDAEYIAAFQQIVMPIAYEVQATSSSHVMLADCRSRDCRLRHNRSCDSRSQHYRLHDCVCALYIMIWLQFAPDLVLVSAGFDAAKNDPLVSSVLCAVTFEMCSGICC